AWMFSYSYMSMMMKDNLAGISKINDDEIFQGKTDGIEYRMSPQKMQMDMHMLMAMYGVSGSFTVMAMANYQVMSMDMMMYAATMTMENGQKMEMSSRIMSTRSTGIGDVKVYG